MPKRLVIDASIARGAGETSHPTSVNCRQWLETIQELKQEAVITTEILEEWKKHESRFARTWRIGMTARKLVTYIRDSQNTALRDEVDLHAPTDKARAEMLKDVHLLEAALRTDEIISSLNTVDRDRFKSIADKVSVIQLIVWVNPDDASENCQDWLKNGASPEPHRMLGYRPDQDE